MIICLDHLPGLLEEKEAQKHLFILEFTNKFGEWHHRPGDTLI